MQRGAGAFLSAALFVCPALPQPVEFNRDIRPILSDKCFTCHGPDEANRKTKLRFDTEAGATQDLGKGRFAIVPGSPEKSEMVRRITSDNLAARMPPAYSGAAKLSEREITLIRRWVEQGARWQKHWSLIKPKRADLPKISEPGWPRNAIDYFVHERLERAGLKPSPEADRATLLRRVTLDLTGLPPTPAETDAFLNDRSPEAYEKVVDRLLASPRYAERVAIRWLDAARYADTNGYQTDAERFMWRWRDWVIEAFDKNMPFDRFTVEQLAGDLLPNPTLSQIIATGFNRNHRGNGEGGIIPEEYAVEYVVDRIETTFTVWQGITMGCARCHDHKYDPFTQKEFYQIYAFFNNIPERGKYFKYGNTPPVITAPTPGQQARLRELDATLADAEGSFAALEPDIERSQRVWEQSLDRSRPLHWFSSRNLVAHFPLDGEAEGKISGATKFDGTALVNGGDKANFGFYDKFTLSAWMYPTAPDGAVITRALDVPEGQGYGLYLVNGKLQFNMVQRWLDDCGRVETDAALELNRWHHVVASYDGSRMAEGMAIYVNGKPQKLTVHVDEINQNFSVKEPLRIGAGNGYRFRGLIDEVRVYDTALAADEVRVLAEAVPVSEIATAAARTKPQADKLRLCFLDQYAPQHIRDAWQRLLERQMERNRFAESLPTVMVMEELPAPRETHLLIRGAYDRPGETVRRSIPAALPGVPPGAPLNRLGLAKWLVDPSNPLTARVTVNRFWQMLFGDGIVRTVEDFGSQGEWPSHPALLDWLATEFIRTGWDVKAILKTIVTSATYRQSSHADSGLMQRDPDNRLLARGPRIRLSPEMVRDQALFVSGLLVEKTGGPSVKPYQPPGLWKELSGGADYQRDKGANLYRRSLYTFWKRAAPPPGMMTFDSAGREACTVRETRTNTPLQALTLMNDVTYVEAARKMAERMIKEGGAAPADRIAYGFRLATARHPSETERKVLLGSFHNYLDRFRTSPEAALKLLSEGDSPRDTSLDTGELAAYASVASLILNLDETITKE